MPCCTLSGRRSKRPLSSLKLSFLVFAIQLARSLPSVPMGTGRPEQAHTKFYEVSVKAEFTGTPCALQRLETGSRVDVWVFT